MSIVSGMIKKVLARRGLGIAKRTPTEDVAWLVRKMHPIRAEAGLVRFGPNRDGGYLVPNDLVGVDYLFSPGVSTESGFELDCAKRGMKCFLADASIDGPTIMHPNFVFTKRFVGSVPSDSYMTIESWVQESIGDAQGDLMLQMDIEGYEYETLLAIPESLLKRFRIIIVEFHDLDAMFVQSQFKWVNAVFHKLLSNHLVVHSHPNNAIRSVRIDGIEIPPLLEITFLRKDRQHSREYETRFPNELDFDCGSKETLFLPREWRS
jgi:hypothetical protein